MQNLTPNSLSSEALHSGLPYDRKCKGPLIFSKTALCSGDGEKAGKESLEILSLKKLRFLSNL